MIRARCFLLGFLILIAAATATTPTFTWSVLGNLIPASQPGPCTCTPCTPITYLNALYYWTAEVGSCACYCPPYHDIEIFIQGPQDLDQSPRKFAYGAPNECDIGTDATTMCKQGGDDLYLWMDPPLGQPQNFGIMGRINGNSIERVSVGNNKWIVGILSGGGSLVYNGNNAWNPISSTVPHLVEISIGNDGVFAYVPQGNAGMYPYACQLNPDMSGSVSGCKQLPIGACSGLHVVNANNIICWNTWGLYWLNGGYNNPSGWTFITLPVAMDQTCFATPFTTPTACITRPNMGGPNASGLGIFSYLGTDGQWHAGTFPFQ